MRVLITGGGGFLGSHIAEMLHQRGDRVAVLGRRTFAYAHLSPDIERIQGDIQDRESLFEAIQGVDAVFHTAAKAGVWGDYEEYYHINVEGTRNVVEGCREHGVEKLIHTSSPSVVFGDKDLEGVDESVPYPNKYLCHYAYSKAMAEQVVLEADGVGGLTTVSLRPHLIWGIGDPHLVPRILERSERGRLVRVGEGKNRVDMVHVENAAHAHVLACDALKPGSRLSGKCYFISDGDPVNLWEWVERLLLSLDREPVQRSISFPWARRIGALLEFVYSTLRIDAEPPMTRFIASQLATSHYFDISRAQRDFGYAPITSPDAGLDRLVEHLREQPYR